MNILLLIAGLAGCAAIAIGLATAWSRYSDYRENQRETARKEAEEQAAAQARVREMLRRQEDTQQAAWARTVKQSRAQAEGQSARLHAVQNPVNTAKASREQPRRDNETTTRETDYTAINMLNANGYTATETIRSGSSCSASSDESSRSSYNGSSYDSSSSSSGSDSGSCGSND